jgi:hypothetical protein
MIPEKTKKLQQTLRELYAYRLTNFGNTAYQLKSNDRHLTNVPSELWELWYGKNGLSFITLKIEYDSRINTMTDDELIFRINNERLLIGHLEKIFSDLQSKKGGNNHGKN